MKTEGGRTVEVFFIRSCVGAFGGDEEIDGGGVDMREVLRPDGDEAFIPPA